MTIAIVWVPMIASDDAGDVEHAAAIFSDARVRQFWDPKRLAGWAFERSTMPTLGEPVWDVYLFYDGASRWSGDDPPRPLAELGQYRADDGTTVVASELDAEGRPIALGPPAKLPELLADRLGRIAP